MSALLESLLHGLEHPDVRAVLEAGLPGPRAEAWKYTPLRALERRAFAPARSAHADAALLAGIPSPDIVFTNGRHDAAASGTGRHVPDGLRIAHDWRDADADADAFAWTADSAGSVFERINALAATGGIALTVDRCIDAAIHLLHVNVKDGEERAVHAHHRIHLRAGASLTLLDIALGDAVHANLDNTRIDIVLEEGARLVHLRVQDDNANASRFLHTHALLHRDAHYRRLDLELGAALSRHELDVQLAGDGAGVVAGGVLLADARRQLDTRLNIVHAASNTRSTLPWRGLATDRARAVFHGGIRIDAGADGSQADLQNRNLLLSDNAEIDTQPVLVIHADEVKAAHGATVGQLDANALFYLRSRGIADADARRMLTAAFCRDLLSAIEDAQLRTLLEQCLDAALARMQYA